MKPSKVEESADKLPPNAGKGRQKGVPNKITREVKEMILEALGEAGGVEYLVRQADEKPVAFLALVGKVMPLQINGAGPNGEHMFTGIKVEFVKPNGNG